MYSGKTKFFKRFTAMVMALMMCLTVTFTVNPTSVSYAEDDKELLDDVVRSVNHVVKATNDLGNTMDPKEVSTIVSIFNGVINAATTFTQLAGFINTNVAFLRLIGVIKDPSSQAFANILEQLAQINEKLVVMDKKLDDLSRQMSEMQAAEEFNTRGIKANQMIKSWQDFRRDYMEDSMDECIRLYDNKLMDGMKAWTEDKTESARQEDPDELITDKVVLVYRANGELRPDKDLHDVYEMVPNAVNFIDWHHARKDVEYPDPYTMYSEELGTNKYIIMDNTFLPGKGDITWALNTYRERIANFIYDKLLAWKEEAHKGHFDWDHMDVKGISPAEIPDSQLREIAEDAVDEITYRVVTYEINKSADFSTRVYKEFGEYCDHLDMAQDGVDAMMKTIFLTNAFEYQAVNDIKAFCNQMLLKAGVYGMFAMNVVGSSLYISDSQKAKLTRDFCDAVDGLEDVLKTSITGVGNYCYVTNTIVNYGEVTMSGHIDMKYSKRGSYASYDCISAGPVKATFDVDDAMGDQQVLVGDTNALVLSYFIRSAGESFDHDYMNEHLTKKKHTKREALITSMSGDQMLPLDASCKLKVHKAIGNYFKDGSEIYLNNLPGGAESEDLVYRRQFTGSKFDGTASRLTTNTCLFGMAAYGESHFYWEKDEAAVMGGPTTEKTFSDVCVDEHTGSSILLDEYYTRHYDASTKYNCLVQIPRGMVGLDTEISKLQDLNLLLDASLKLKKLAQTAEKTADAGRWTEDSLARFRSAINKAKKCAENDEASLDKIELIQDELMEAWYSLKASDKKSQTIKVSVKNKTLKASALKKSNKKVAAIKVKSAQGKVTYSLRTVSKKKFRKFFSVNASSGKITVKKGLKKGTYKVSVRLSAKGTAIYDPATKVVNVKIKVK